MNKHPTPQHIAFTTAALNHADTADAGFRDYTLPNRPSLNWDHDLEHLFIVGPGCPATDPKSAMFIELMRSTYFHDAGALEVVTVIARSGGAWCIFLDGDIYPERLARDIEAAWRIAGDDGESNVHV